MAYRVIKDFADLKDGKYIYHVGDEYPRHGVAPTKERIVFLLSNQNLLHTPVIEELPGSEGALNPPVEQGTEEEQEQDEEKAQDAAEGAEKAVEAVSGDETKEYKPKRTRRSKTAKNG